MRPTILLTLGYMFGTTHADPPNNVCTPGRQVATYEELQGLPITDGNTGLTTFSPYLGLNYIRFQVADGAWSNVLVYTLSQLSATLLSPIQLVLAGLLGPLGSLPAVLPQPSITGATDQTTLRLEALDVYCGIRNAGTVNVLGGLGRIPFPCHVTIQPVEPELSGYSASCSFSGAPMPERCNLTGNNLPVGRGFKLRTYGDVTLPQLGVLQTQVLAARILNPLAEFALVTVMDNVTYTISCNE